MDVTIQTIILWVFVIWEVALAHPQINRSTFCPFKCTCNSPNITCTKQQLETIPDFRKLNNDPTYMDLSDNDIEEIKEKSFSFKRSEHLKTLIISDNSLLEIESNSFTSLQNLESLDLSNNLLEEVSSDLVVKNTKLIELDLSGNLFNLNTPTLKSASLKVLDLSFCKLSIFEEKNLQDLPNLLVLHLHANSLVSFDYNILKVSPQLSHIDLEYNSWACNCDTLKLFKHLTEKGLTKITKPVQCMHPNKWYEDIYDKNGPMHHDKLCRKKPHMKDHPVKKIAIPEIYENDSENMLSRMENNNEKITMMLGYELWIALAVMTSLLISCGIVLYVIWKKLKRTQQKQWETQSCYSQLS